MVKACSIGPSWKALLPLPYQLDSLNVSKKQLQEAISYYSIYQEKKLAPCGFIRWCFLFQAIYIFWTRNRYLMQWTPGSCSTPKLPYGDLKHTLVRHQSFQIGGFASFSEFFETIHCWGANFSDRGSQNSDIFILINISNDMWGFFSFFLYF